MKQVVDSGLGLPSDLVCRRRRLPPGGGGLLRWQEKSGSSTCIEEDVFWFM